MSSHRPIKNLRVKMRYWTIPQILGRLGFFGPRRSAESRKCRAVIIAPAPSGSLGDEAMMLALTEQLGERGVDEIIMVAWRKEDDWQGVGKLISQVRLPRNKLLRWFQFARAIRSAQALYVIGADVIDGAYGMEHSLSLLAAVQFAARCGLPSTIIGCSFCDHPDPRVVQYLRQLDPRVRLLSRDAYSRGRMEKAIHRRVPLVADMAFLLKSAPATEYPAVARVAVWILRQRGAGRGPVIGCNLNPQPLIMAGKDPENLLAAYESAFKQWRESVGPGLTVVIMPHDYRREHKELEICETFYERLPADLKANTLLLRDPLAAVEVKAIAGLCDVVLTGRMHLAIAALGSGRPVACLGYQSKFEGMLAHFGLEELILDWREAILPGNLAVWGGSIVAGRAGLAGRVAANLPFVTELARANLDTGRQRGEIEEVVLQIKPRHQAKTQNCP